MRLLLLVLFLSLRVQASDVAVECHPEKLQPNDFLCWVYPEPEGDPKDPPTSKDYRWETTRDGGWRMVRANIATTPPQGPGTTTRTAPPPRPHPDQYRVDWGAGGSANKRFYQAAFEYKNLPTGIRVRLEHQRTHLSGVSRQTYRRRSLQEWDFDAGMEFENNIIEGRTGFRVERDEAFLIDSFARVYADINFKLNGGKKLGPVEKIYAGFSVAAGNLNVDGEGSNEALAGALRVGCDVEIVDDFLDLNTEIMAESISSTSDVIHGGHYAFQTQLVFHLTRNLDCAVKYENEYFDHSGPGIPQRRQRAFVTMSVRF